MIMTRDDTEFGDICFWKDDSGLYLNSEGYWENDTDSFLTCISAKKKFKIMFPNTKLPRKGKKKNVIARFYDFD